MPGRILFKTTPDGTQTPVEAMRIDSAQNATLATGNLVIGTYGKGIDFSATPGTGTSELLADYEEGTWTPTFANFGTTSVISAVYTKIGRSVTIQLTMTATDVLANSSNFTLPFICARITAGVFTRATLEGGFVEAQQSTLCYFASTPSVTSSTYYVTLTYTV
jgi:hypothetical protein